MNPKWDRNIPQETKAAEEKAEATGCVIRPDLSSDEETVSAASEPAFRLGPHAVSAGRLDALRLAFFTDECAALSQCFSFCQRDAEDVAEGEKCYFDHSRQQWRRFLPTLDSCSLVTLRIAVLGMFAVACVAFHCMVGARFHYGVDVILAIFVAILCHFNTHLSKVARRNCGSGA